MNLAVGNSDPTTLEAIAEQELGRLKVVPDRSTVHDDREVEMRMVRGCPALGKSGSTFPLFAYSGFSSQRPERWELRARNEEPNSPTQLVASPTVGESATRTVSSSRGCEWCPPNAIASGYGGIDSSIPADWLGARDFELILEFRGPEGTVATRAIPFQLLVQ
jgi:hypothetical protein